MIDDLFNHTENHITLTSYCYFEQSIQPKYLSFRGMASRFLHATAPILL